jgi:hypothetical protein
VEGASAIPPPAAGVSAAGASQNASEEERGFMHPANTAINAAISAANIPAVKNTFLLFIRYSRLSAPKQQNLPPAI